MSQTLERRAPIEPPAPPAEQDTPDGRRPRSRRWLLWTLLALVVVLATSITLLVRYQPLVPGNEAVGAGPGGRITNSPPNLESVSAIRFRNGAVVTYGFSLRNDGPVGLTITSVIDPHSEGVLRTMTIRMNRENEPGASADPADYTPFQSFRLGPDEERFFLIKAQFARCDSLAADSWSTYADVPVTYRVLGFTHHAWVPLELPIAVQGVRNACGSG
jgi:uncharacterized repeat protein (TIGR01451 family)